MVTHWIRSMALWFELKSLRQRMIAINMITIGVTLLLLSGALVVHEYQIYQAWHALVFALAGVAAVGMAVLLTDRLLAASSRPLLQLIELMERVSSDKDFSVRAKVHEEHQVGALALGFNKMLDRLEQREGDLRRELSERKRVERRLTMLAHFDTLTRLPNRNYFNQRLTGVLLSVVPDELVALLFLDFDNFKIVNGAVLA